MWNSASCSVETRARRASTQENELVTQDQITRDLEAAFQAMGYAYVIARLSSVDAVPETERQGAIAELREIGQVRVLTRAETVANI